LEWYQNNQTTQVLGNALSSFEKQMNKAWKSGPAGKSAALVIQGTLTGVDVFTGGSISTAVGYFARQVRDEMEEEKLEMAKKAAAEIAKAQEEASAKAKVPKLEVIINQLQADIRQKDLEKAKQLFAAAKRLEEEARKTDDEKGERMATQKPSQLTRSSQETMYQPTNEIKDKKMTKKYSSFKDQQRITENFRRFINEEETKAEWEADRAAARAGEDRLKSMQGDFGGPDETPAGVSQDWDVSDEGVYLEDEEEWVPGVYLKGKWVPLEDGFSRGSLSTHSTAGTNSPGKVANRLIDTANDLADEARDYEARITPDERDALLDIFTSDVFDKIEAARGAEKLAKPISKGKFFEVKTRKRR